MNEDGLHDQDEAIISSTFAELAFFLVFVFAMAAALIGSELAASDADRAKKTHAIGEMLKGWFRYDGRYAIPATAAPAPPPPAPPAPGTSVPSAPVHPSAPTQPQPNANIHASHIERIKKKLDQNPVSCLYEKASGRSTHPNTLDPSRTIIPEAGRPPGDDGQVPLFEHADYVPDPKTIIHMRWQPGSDKFQFALNLDPNIAAANRTFVFLDDAALGYFNNVVEPLLQSFGWVQRSQSRSTWAPGDVSGLLTIAEKIRTANYHAHPADCHFAVLLLNFDDLEQKAKAKDVIALNVRDELSRLQQQKILILRRR